MHDSEVVVVESGGALKSLSSPMQEDVHICQVSLHRLRLQQLESPTRAC